METTIAGYIETTIRTHSFIPSFQREGEGRNMRVKSQAEPGGQCEMG